MVSFPSKNEKPNDDSLTVTTDETDEPNPLAGHIYSTDAPGIPVVPNVGPIDLYVDRVFGDN